MANVLRAPAAETAPDRTRVFLSYSRKDAATADRLCDVLEARGFAVSIDKSEIVAFEDWWQRLQTMIGEADTLLFAVTANSVRSEVCQKEIDFATSLNKRLAPVICEPVKIGALPEAIRRLHLIRFDDAEKSAEQADEIARALRTDIAWIRQHTRFGENARRWVAGGRQTGLLLRSPLLEEAEQWLASRPDEAPKATDDTLSYIRDSRTEVTRRRRILTSSLASGLVLALALAGAAAWQWRIASIQRNHAQQALGVATRTATSLHFDLTQKMKELTDVPQDVASDILDRAQKIVDDLSESFPSNAELMLVKARALVEAAQQYRANSDARSANRAAAAAIDILGGLPADGGDAETLYVLSTAHEIKGTSDADLGRLNDARQAYDKSLTLRRTLAMRDNRRETWRAGVASVLDNLGVLEQIDGRLDMAEARFREALAIRRALATGSSREPDDRLDAMATSEHHLGAVLAVRQKFTESRQHMASALSIRETAAVRTPHSKIAQKKLAYTLDTIAEIDLMAAAPDAARGRYEKSHAIREHLAAAASADRSEKLEVIQSFANLGTVDVRLGKSAAAVQMFESALAAQETLLRFDEQAAAATPADAIRRLAVVRSLGNIAWYGLLARKFDRAIEAADRALALAPEQTWILQNKAHGLLLAGRFDDAKAIYGTLPEENAINVGAIPVRTGLLKDFASLKDAGLAHAPFDAMEAALADAQRRTAR